MEEKGLRLKHCSKEIMLVHKNGKGCRRQTKPQTPTRLEDKHILIKGVKNAMASNENVFGKKDGKTLFVFPQRILSPCLVVKAILIYYKEWLFWA